MAGGPDANSAAREYSQLLRVHEQLLSQIVRSRDELLAPSMDLLVKRIKGQTGSEPDLTELKTAIEESIRSTQAVPVEYRVRHDEGRRDFDGSGGHK